MAAVVFRGQPRRWGNESANFYQASYTKEPGIPSRQKTYRCEGSQYANSGHYHLGTKALSLNPPLDQYGSSTAYKLRCDDQRLPKALVSCQPSVQNKRMTADQPTNLYRSHQQRYHSYAMPTAPMKRSMTEQLGGQDSLTRSLSKAFYVTSYQSDISKYAAQRKRSNSEGSGNTLCKNLTARRNSIASESAVPTHTTYKRHSRVLSAPPVRPIPTVSSTTVPKQESSSGLLLQRRRSFSAIQQDYPSRGEMLKDIFTAFPAPQPEAASKKQGRPSSAVSIRSGKIPGLRSNRTEAWV